MTNKPLRIGFSGSLLACILLLGGCTENSSIDDPGNASSYLTVDKIDPQLVDSSLAAASSDTVSVTIGATWRSDLPATTFGEITVESYTVIYEPPLPDAGGAIAALSYATTLTIPANGTSNLTATVIPEARKGSLGAAVNSVFTGTVVVEGRDVNGNSSSAEGSFSIVIGP